MMSEWQPIETAPRDGTIVRVWREEFGEFVMAWNDKRSRWEGKHWGPIRALSIWWDIDAPQPTHWRAIETD